MSDTPRTDAAWYASESGAGCEPLLKCSLQLERELRESEVSAAVMREALGRQIQGLSPLDYLHVQFPATIGHIPLNEFFHAQADALTEWEANK